MYQSIHCMNRESQKVKGWGERGNPPPPLFFSKVLGARQQIIVLTPLGSCPRYGHRDPPGGGRDQTVYRPKICSKVIFYIPKHSKTLSKRFGTFRGRQRTFKSHFYNFFENYDFLCIFPLHHHTGFTQELGIDRFKYLF